MIAFSCSAGQHADRGARLLGRRGSCGGGDDDRLRRGRKLQLNGEGLPSAGMETCCDCSANPGASTTSAILPVGKMGNVAVPSPAVVCTPTPALSLARNRLTCTPETRSPEGLCTDTLRSAGESCCANTAGDENHGHGERRTRRHDTPPLHAKGVGDVVRAGLLACELRLASRTAAGPSRLHSGLSARDSLTVARQRGLHTRFPVPPDGGTREHRLARNNPETQHRLRMRLTTVLAGASRCQSRCAENCASANAVTRSSAACISA